MTARENVRLVLHTVSADTPTGRASRRCAEDVFRLEAVRAAAAIVAPRTRVKGARALRKALDTFA